ncbi:DNA-binding CsgD family transcriptional regulator [Nocardia kruczakiae]|uniref:DNA-binding CsgD family transcriptional regulator n=1 Tax=Nocardia kruczakiae TaxID=261477 RepID=A0ABU1XAF2_9NOCA|nr:LuxR C-terminal-related transcriptional regulator [Nocardia kruczakiae]MDR7167042.1 DNA-binding CsgD family transcriptional regulator [Nocardia kruczakiae]
MSESAVRTRLAAALELRDAAAGSIGGEPLKQQAARLLFALRRVVAYDHAALSIPDPVTGEHTTYTNFGYSTPTLDLINDAMPDTELYGELRETRLPVLLHDVDRRRRRGVVFDIIRRNGFRDGLSHCLYSPHGRHLGMLNLSTYTPLDEHTLPLTTLVSDALAAAVDPLRPTDGGAIAIAAGEQALLIDLDGTPRPLTAGARTDLAALIGRVRPVTSSVTMIHGAQVYEVRVDEVRGGTLVRHRPAPPPAGLTLRELEVLELLSHGAANTEIARTLRIGASTVATHVEAILRRTGSSNRTAAAVYATRIGLCRSA